jgi:hypothetical protein
MLLQVLCVGGRLPEYDYRHPKRGMCHHPETMDAARDVGGAGKVIPVAFGAQTVAVLHPMSTCTKPVVKMHQNSCEAAPQAAPKQLSCCTQPNAKLHPKQLSSCTQTSVMLHPKLHPNSCDFALIQ